MPTEDTPSVAPADPDAFRAAFLADLGPGDTATGDEPTAVVADPDDPDSAGDSGDDPDASTEPGDDPDDPAAEPAPKAVPAHLAKLNEAIEAADPERFIAALGDKAEALLGSKGHKALRQVVKEIKVSRASLLSAGEALKAKYGDPAAITAAFAKGDADAVVEGFERFSGASWADLIKFVNASFAGKPARLEAKQREQQQAQTIEQTRRAAAETSVRADIEATAKKAEPKLFAAHPALTELVFAKMRTHFRLGLDTPAKALAAVKKELEQQHKSLGKVFSGKGAVVTPGVPQPTGAPGPKGREMTSEEFRASFVAQHQREQRARKGV